LKVFLSGIAGTGMSALAGLFTQKGFEVLGSDINFYPPVGDILKQMGVTIYRSFDAGNIPFDVDFCVIGNVISRGNPEAEFILNNGLEYYSMADALYRFFIKGKKGIVVSGTHGKTTISSFVAHLFEEAGTKPGFFIGGKPKNFSSNYAYSDSEYFVVEGDEYETSFFDRSSKFLKYHPWYLIISSLEYDHVDFFESEYRYLKSFKDLVNQVPGQGLIIANGDYQMTRQAVANAMTPVITYGAADASVTISDINLNEGYYTFSLNIDGEKLSFQTQLTGRYNIWNLCAGIILGLRCGFSLDRIQEATKTFMGVERRLTQINQLKNTIIFEDFAHHPTSIHYVLNSLKERFPEKRLICFFEPRSWSLRKNVFQDQLAKSLLQTDELVIKDVYQKGKILKEEQLDLKKLSDVLSSRGIKVEIFGKYEMIQDYLTQIDMSEPNCIVIISNGSFGDLPAVARHLSGV